MGRRASSNRSVSGRPRRRCRSVVLHTGLASHRLRPLKGMIHTHIDIQVRSLIRNNGYEIHCNDFEPMSIDRKLEMRINRRVDNPDAVALPRLKGSLETRTAIWTRVLAIDQAVVEFGRSDELCVRVQLVGGPVRPVAEHNGLELFIVICSGGAVDYNGSEDTVPGL